LETGAETALGLFEISHDCFTKSEEKYPHESQNTLSVTDNRTGQSYELQI
jgi:hypothetical protein